MDGSETRCAEKILLLTPIPLQIIEEKFDLKMLISDPSFFKFCLKFPLSLFFEWLIFLILIHVSGPKKFKILRKYFYRSILSLVSWSLSLLNFVFVTSPFVCLHISVNWLKRNFHMKNMFSNEKYETIFFFSN